MYSNLVNIVVTFSVISRVQSYDIILNHVSVAYGKCAEKTKYETATNQRIMKNSSLHPMEKNQRRYGKRVTELTKS